MSTNSSDAKSSSDLSNLTDAELKAYQINKAKWFKGTIAVCVVYGVFAILLLMLAMFNDQGRQILSEGLLPFTITFVGGMIVVIILLIIQITTFKPKTFQRSLYDRDMCPDYWKAVPANTETDIPSTANTSDQYLMKVKCVPDPEVFDFNVKWNANAFAPIGTADANRQNVLGQKKHGDGNTSFYYAQKTASPDTAETKLFEVSKKMYGETLNGVASVPSLSNLRCDVVFPSLLAKEDEMQFKDRPNAMRCKYAELCGVSWSSVCP